jgi:hypothetical protein
MTRRRIRLAEHERSIGCPEATFAIDGSLRAGVTPLPCRLDAEWFL